MADSDGRARDLRDQPQTQAVALDVQEFAPSAEDSARSRSWMRARARGINNRREFSRVSISSIGNVAVESGHYYDCSCFFQQQYLFDGQQSKPLEEIFNGHTIWIIPRIAKQQRLPGA